MALENGISVLIGSTEYDYPLKERQVFRLGDGERYGMVERFGTVSFNEGIDEETFEFEPPGTITVESR